MCGIFPVLVNNERERMENAGAKLGGLQILTCGSNLTQRGATEQSKAKGYRTTRIGLYMQIRKGKDE